MADIEKLCFGCMREKPDFSPECPHCKFDETNDNDPQALPIKTLLQKRYYVGKIFNENGEGFTYIGYDILKDCPVRIREYFPSGMAQRINTLVKPLAQFGFAFENYRLEFNSLAKNLLRMNGFSGLLNILDIFEENGTSYYITEYVEAITLRDFLLRNGGILNFDQIRPMLMPLLSTLSSLHSVDIIHRGISPDTILVGKDGKLRLTEFCIKQARTARTDFKASLHKGYAAIEQYGFEGEQGPWTDVYALGALVYRMLVGNPPPEATVRVTDDKMTIPADVAKSLSGGALSALANSLEIMPEERTSSVEEFRSDILSAPKLSPKYNSKTGEVKAVASRQYRRKIIIISACAALICLALVAAVLFVFYDNSEQKDENTTITATTSVENVTVDDSDNITEVQNYVGLKISDLLSDAQYLKERARLNFDVESKKYDSTPKGTIISQSPKAGTKLKKNQTVKFVVSLGPRNFSMPNIVGLSKQDALIKLLEAGFSVENIQFGEKYLPNSTPDAVSDVSPSVGSTVTGDEKVTVNVNIYVTTTTTTTEATTTTTTTTTTKKTAKKTTTTKAEVLEDEEYDNE